jgi:hypothetical protein
MILQEVFQLTDKQKLLCRSLASMEEAAGSSAQAVAQALREKYADEELFQEACANQVETILAHRFDPVGDARDIPPHWRLRHAENHRRLSSYLSELDAVASFFRPAGIALVALKNGGIARGIYPCPGCCPMGDLDTLIERRHFRRAHEILVKNGYTFQFRSSLEEDRLEHAEASGGAEYWKILSNGEKMWLELQWRPVAGRWIRPDQEPSAEELMARSISIPGTAVRLLAPEDNLLQVCLHTAKHSYVRAPGFRLHLDVDRIVHYQAIDWELFLQRVLALQVKTAVYFSLALPAALFAAPIPARVLEALRPPAWKEKWIAAWLNRAGLFNPDEKKFSRAGYILFTALLYDDARGLLRAIFPEMDWMVRRYHVGNHLLLPYYHIKRWIDLALRRNQT